MDRNRSKSKLSQKILFAGSIGAILGCIIYLIMIVNAGVKSMLLPFRFFDFKASFGDSSNLLDGLFNMADSIGNGINTLLGDMTSYLSAVVSIKLGITFFYIFFAIFIAALIYNAIKLNNKRIKLNTSYNIMFAIGSVSAIISIISLAKLVKFSSFVASIQYERIFNFSSYPPNIDINYLASLASTINTLGIAGFNPSFGIIMLSIAIVCFSVGAYAIYKIAFGKKKSARPKMQSTQKSANRPAAANKAKPRPVDANEQAARPAAAKKRKRPVVEEDEEYEQAVRPVAAKKRREPSVEADAASEEIERKKKASINEEESENLELYEEYVDDEYVDDDQYDENDENEDYEDYEDDDEDR